MSENYSNKLAFLAPVSIIDALWVFLGFVVAIVLEFVLYALKNSFGITSLSETLHMPYDAILMASEYFVAIIVKTKLLE